MVDSTPLVQTEIRLIDDIIDASQDILQAKDAYAQKIDAIANWKLNAVKNYRRLQRERISQTDANLVNETVQAYNASMRELRTSVSRRNLPMWLEKQQQAHNKMQEAYETLHHGYKRSPIHRSVKEVKADMRSGMATINRNIRKIKKQLARQADVRQSTSEVREYQAAAKKLNKEIGLKIWKVSKQYNRLNMVVDMEKLANYAAKQHKAADVVTHGYQKVVNQVLSEFPEKRIKYEQRNQPMTMVKPFKLKRIIADRNYIPDEVIDEIRTLARSKDYQEIFANRKRITQLGNRYGGMKLEIPPAEKPDTTKIMGLLKQIKQNNSEFGNRRNSQIGIPIINGMNASVERMHATAPNAGMPFKLAFSEFTTAAERLKNWIHGHWTQFGGAAHRAGKQTKINPVTQRIQQMMADMQAGKK